MNKSNFLYQSLHTFSTKGVILILSFISGVLVARLLGPSGKGVIALFFALSAIILPLGELGIRQSTAFLIGQKKYHEHNIYANMMALFLVSSAACLLILAMIYSYNDFFNKYGFLITFLFLIMAPISLFQSCNNGILIGKKKIEKVNYIILCERLSAFVLLILFVYLFKYQVLGAVWSFFIGKLLSVGLIIVWLFNCIKIIPRFDRKIVGEMLRKGVLFATALFIIQLNYRIDMIMLGKLRGEFSLGIYSVGVNICELLKEFPMSIGLVLFSRSTNWKDTVSEDLLNKISFLSRTFLWVMAILGSLLATAAHFIIPLIYGLDFSASAKVIVILVPGIVILSTFLILNFFMAGQGRPQYSIYVFLPALILNVILNSLWIPKYDYLGAALSSTISYSFATFLFMLIFHKIYKVKFMDLIIPRKSDLKKLCFTLTNRRN